MKKIILILMLASLMITGCDEKKQRSTPEKSQTEEVKLFVAKFIKFVNSNAIDSVKAMYKGLDPMDVKFVTLYERPKVEENAEKPGKFDVSIGEVKLVVTRENNGTLKVTESYGLFTYEPNVLELAKKTGQYKDGLNDIELAKRMTDKGFYEYYKSLQNKPLTNPLKLGKLVVTHKGGQESNVDFNEGYVSVTNTSSQPVSGNDFKLIYYRGNYFHMAGREPEEVDEDEFGGDVRENGKDIDAGGSVKYSIKWDGYGSVDDFRIEWLAKKKPYMPTGKEYDDYLKMKK